MPASTVSLESLSSPSPSPPPPEEHNSNHSGAAGLDSGSELSELTEDEQDNDSRANEDDASGAPSRRKRTRDRIVPAPMWDWAYKQKKSEKKSKSDWSNKPVEEEEEEEEQAGPAKAMEEEEDDDLDKDSNPDADDDAPRKRRVVSDDADDNDVEDDPPEDDGESADEAPSRQSRKGTSGDVSAEEEDDVDDGEPDVPDADVDRTPKVAGSPDLSDEEGDNVGEEEVDDDEQPDDPGEALKDDDDVEEDEDDPEADVPADDADALDGEEAPTTGVVTPAEGFVDAAEGDPDATMDVDAPPPVLMSPVAVAASSIMAGSTIIQPESPGSSQPSTPSASRMSSRYPSAEPEQEPDAASEPEAEPEPERKPSGGRAPRSRKGKARTRAGRRSRAAAADAGDADADADHAEGVEGDNGDADDMDVATPDLDLDSDMQPAHRAEALDELAAIELKFALLRERLYVEKMDTLAWEEGLIADGTHPELLHLHAELSKRRDKRLELASRRRDYEVANVTKRRRLDEEGVWSWWKDARDELQTEMISETNSKRRRLERERRALERPQPTRRFPAPPLDAPPAPTLREIVKSSPFGIPEAALPQSKRLRLKKEPPPPATLIYPQISSLPPEDVLRDLELFFQHRGAPVMFDPHRGGPGLMNSVLGGMPPPGMNPYAMGMQVLDGPTGNRFAPPFHQPPLHQQGGFPPPPSRLPHHHSAPPGSLPHMNHHSQMQMEQEMAMGMRPPSGMPQHPAQLQQQLGPGPGGLGPLMRRSISPVPLSNGAGPSSGIPTTMGGGPLPPGFAGPKLNGWTGPPTGVHMTGGKEPHRANGEIDGRDRERERQGEQRDRDRAQRDMEREREREAERAYHMSHGQPRHITHQHAHQHAHGSTQGQSGHLPHHHVHHHHHVRHHHHTSHQSFSGPGGSSHAPPMASLPSGSNSGPAPPSQTHSPRSSRDAGDQRRMRSGAPTELIELSAGSQKPPTGASPRMSGYWQGKDEPLPPEAQRELERERGRVPPGPGGPSPPGPHERMVTPFTMGPSQPLHSSPRPGSPRGMPGPANHPPSMPTSRRGSWSGAGEDRPPSAPHGPSPPGGAPAGPSQRPPSSRMAQPPSGPSYHSPFSSPPYSNGRPPASPPPSFAGPIRSPGRSAQSNRGPSTLAGPGGMPMSPPPPPPGTHSPHLGGSPGGSKMSSRGRPPSPRLGKGPSKMEGFPVPESGNIAPIVTGAGSAAGPATLPPLPSHLPPAAPSRLSNGGLPEKPPAHLPGGPPPTQVVPVDGS